PRLIWACFDHTTIAAGLRWRRVETLHNEKGTGFKTACPFSISARSWFKWVAPSGNLTERSATCLPLAERELVTRCIGAGGAAWDPGGAEWRAAESTGLQRRNAASTSG